MSFNFKFEFQTIKAKFTAVTMCIVTLVTISLTIISSIFISKSSYDSMYSLMKPLSGQISQNVMTVIKEQKNICDTIAKDESVTEGYVFSADPVMKSPIDDGDALAYSIFNADGSVWLSSGNTLVDFSKNSAFTKAIAGEQTLSVPYQSGNNIYIDIATPVLRDNAVVYVLVYTFDINDVILEFNSFQFGQTGFATLINKDGILIAGKGTAFSDYFTLSKTEKKYESSAEFYKKIISENTYGTGDYTSTDGNKTVGCYSPIEGTDWYMIVSASKSEFSRSMITGIFLTLGVGIIMMVLAFFLTRRIVENVMRPVVASSQRLQALSNGDINSPVSTVYGSDEISVLSRSLDETVTSLKIYISKINSGLTAISEGNLVYKMDGDWRGDFIRIKSTFNEILESLRQTFSNIDSASKQVNDGAMQVSGGAQTLSQGATQQSSAINELASQVISMNYPF